VFFLNEGRRLQEQVHCGQREHYQVQGKVMQGAGQHQFRVNWTTAMKSSPTSPARCANTSSHLRAYCDRGDFPYEPPTRGRITYRARSKQATQEATEAGK